MLACEIMKYSVVQSNVNMMSRIDLSGVLAESGSLEVRIADSRVEILAAQSLRYQIFYEEMGAKPTPAMLTLARDFDAFDEICDHLLVVDRNRKGRHAVVGTYRLLREEVAGGLGGFYSGQEYDMKPLLSPAFRERLGAGRQLLELGRSCVHPDYRNNTTIHMLWRGIAAYTRQNRVGFMFGCASLPGTDPHVHAMALSHLYHEYAVPDEFRVRAHGDRFHEMNLIPRDQVDLRQARRALPPLVKGYLRLGCYIGDGAVIDEQFGTTDVFILLPVDQITDRYLQHFQLGAAADDVPPHARPSYGNVVAI